MLKILPIIAILLVSNYSLTACSTVIVHSKKSTTSAPYSGTRRASYNTARSLKKFDYYGEVFIWAMDIPMCLITDTLLLPYDLYQQYDK